MSFCSLPATGTLLLPCDLPEYNLWDGTDKNEPYLSSNSWWTKGNDSSLLVFLPCNDNGRGDAYIKPSNEIWSLKCTIIFEMPSHRNQIIEGLVRNTFRVSLVLTALVPELIFDQIRWCCKILFILIFRIIFRALWKNARKSFSSLLSWGRKKKYLFFSKVSIESYFFL